MQMYHTVICHENTKDISINNCKQMVSLVQQYIILARVFHFKFRQGKGHFK